MTRGCTTDRPLPPNYTELRRVPELTKQRSKRPRQKTDAQFTVRLSPEARAYFEDMHHAHAEWAGAGAHSKTYAKLRGFLERAARGLPDPLP